MFSQPSKILFAVSIAGLFALAPLRLMAQAQPPTSQEPQRNFKDRAEYDLYVAINGDSNPKTKLEKLQQWQSQYPATEWAKERRTLLLTTYSALNMAKETVDIARQILADSPNDFSAQYYIMYYTQALSTANPTDTNILDQGAKCATSILAGINTPPPNVPADQWPKLRPDIELLAHVTLGFVAMTKKDWTTADMEFRKSLQMSPNNAQVDWWMGTVILSTGKEEKQSEALFYFARAATYEGTGALSADFRKQGLAYLDRQYKRYHGSGEDFDKLLALAKTQATPPADFHIKSAQELAQANAAAQAKWAEDHPEEALWKNLKTTLTGAEGATYFNNSMKDARVPALKGKVVKLEPAVRPKTVVLAIEDGTTPDATLKMEAPLPGKVELGTELTFEGVPESYSASPFMVVFNVEKEKLQGWTGKNAPATHTGKPPSKGKVTAKK